MKLKLLALLVFSSFWGYAQITIDESLTVQQLVEDVLINSDCAEVSNFLSSTGTDFGDDNGIAAFDANGSDFSFEAGVILSSGNVANAPGPNFDINSDGGGGWPGDTDLETYTTATQTNNASWIQFDFMASISQISFDFLMVSEEYDQNFECDFSDAFAFILTDQTTGDVINLAVLPGTNIPIEVTNIRPEVPGQCPAVNEEYFGRYNFEPSPNTLPFISAAEAPIDFNGQTQVLTAMADVVIGNPYTIKLVVADQQDTAFDIAVFLGANSFNIGNVDLGDDISIGNGTAACVGDIINLEIELIENANYQWFKDGVAIEGETTNLLDVTEDGLYGIEVTFAIGDCVASDEVLIEFRQVAEFDLGEAQFLCEGDQIILDATPSNLDDLVVVFYKWFKDGVEIAGETTEFLTVSEFGLYSCQVIGNGCPITDEVEIAPVVFAVDLGGDQEVCDQESVTIIAELDGNIDPTIATYLWSTGEVTPGITVEENGDYSVTVTYNSCVETGTANITFSENPIINLGGDFESCFNTEDVLDASPSNYDPAEASYVWSLDGVEIAGETTNTLFVNQLGTYTVVVTVGICSSTDTVTITPRTDLSVELGADFKACPNVPTTLTAITNEEDASFVWFKNDTQLSEETNNTLVFSIPETDSGIQIFTVQMTVGDCVTSTDISVIPYEVDVCTISQGISPNGDGMNDEIDLEFLADRSGPFTMEVFNRHGMSVFTKSNYINDFKGISSDGVELPTGTYYYVITFETPDAEFGPVKTGWVYINKDAN